MWIIENYSVQITCTHACTENLLEPTEKKSYASLN